MGSKTVKIVDSSYTKLDTTPGSALDCQCLSEAVVRIKFADSVPSSGGYRIYRDQAVLRNGHTGDMYAIVEQGKNAILEVGE